MTNKPHILRTQAEEDLLRQFQERFSDSDDPITELRDDAFGAMREVGLPHRRVEEYKYTDLKAAIRSVPDIVARPDLEAARKALADAGTWGTLERHRLVFVDGYYFSELSDADVSGVSVKGVADALAGGAEAAARIGKIAPPTPDPVLDLNTAFMVDGVFIDIASSFQGGKPIEIVFASVSETPAAHYVRSTITVAEGAKATLLETHVGRNGIADQSNIVFEADIADAAELTWIKVQQSGDSAIHLGSTLSVLGAGSTFDHFIFTVGSNLSRSQSFLKFSGEGSAANLRGVSMLRDDNHADVTLVVDHAVPECVSQERFKSVIDDKAKGVFQGKIIVQPDAQKTDGQMMTQTLLLSDDAQVANKPELEIFADDVQCAHGATTGQIDEDLLFYLMARGIPEEQARTLLVLAFIGETIEEIGDDSLIEPLEALSRTWLLGDGGRL